MTQTPNQQSSSTLQRQLGVGGAVMMGLGSILGTGVFVSIGIAAGIAGPAVVLAIVIAAGVATCNALSSAQLAAGHPVSGGTYEYGYRWLAPWLGFAAGWMFLCAKSASAATAALGFAGYLLQAAGVDAGSFVRPIALAAVAVLTGIVLGGIRRSHRVNVTIVTMTIAALFVFIFAGLPPLWSSGGEHLVPFFARGGESFGTTVGSLLHAAAIMFVAYTGYGRIATLGEEVRAPRRTIPRAIIATLIISASLYVAVGLVGVGTAGAEALHVATGKQAAPLAAVLGAAGRPWAERFVAVGAVTAVLGVLLNLILGLSRVLLAMARRRDMPGRLARLDAAGTTPPAAVLAVGGVIAALTLTGDVTVTWSFSAFTVLLYYAITNLAALRLPADQRLFSPVYAACGLVGCLMLAFWVQPAVWLTGLGVLAAGLGWHTVASAAVRRSSTGEQDRQDEAP